MSRRATWRAFAAGLALSVSCGCGGFTMTAANSVNPVMFGPVKILGAETAARGSSAVEGGKAFHHRVSAFGTVLCLGIGYAGYGAASTDPAGDDETGSEWALNRADTYDGVWLDWRVFRATGENPLRRVELTSVRCGGASAFLPLVYAGTGGCELKGFVPATE